MRFAALAGDDCARSANDCSRIVEGNGFLRNIESLRSRCQVSGKPRAGGTEKMGRLSSWTVYCRLSFIRLVVRCSRTWISQNPKKISSAEFRGCVSMSVLKFAGVLCIDQDSMVGFELTSQVPFPQWQHTLYISILVCVCSPEVAVYLLALQTLLGLMPRTTMEELPLFVDDPSISCKTHCYLVLIRPCAGFIIRTALFQR